MNSNQMVLIMNRVLKILALSLLLISNLLAQNSKPTSPKFNGTWILDINKTYSDKSERESYKDYILEISDDETIFKENTSYVYKGKPVNYKRVLFTDKRGETNTISSPNYTFEVKSTTERKKDSIVSNFNYSGQETIKTNIFGKETYNLSRDGKKLTIVVANSVESPTITQMLGQPLGPQKYKLIFNKKE